MLEASDRFFDLPMEEKMAYYSSDMTAPLRYGTGFAAHGDSGLQWRDYVMLPSKLTEEVRQSWPSIFRKELLEYIHEMNKLAKLLLELVSEILQLDADTLEKFVGSNFEHQSTGLNYYPPCPQPDLTIGLRCHSDKSMITILLQDGSVSGLQVAHETGWLPVDPLADAFVVNLGDVMEILSNGRYKSAEHRAIVNSTSRRLSLASFYNVSRGATIGPLPDLVDKNHPEAFKEIILIDFFKHFVAKQLYGKHALDYVRIKDAKEI